jgi:hypothetical protein
MVGGFVVTDRMLEMFGGPTMRRPGAGDRAGDRVPGEDK